MLSPIPVSEGIQIMDKVGFYNGQGLAWGTVIKILPGDFLQILPDSHPNHWSLLMLQQVVQAYRED